MRKSFKIGVLKSNFVMSMRKDNSTMFNTQILNLNNGRNLSVA